MTESTTTTERIHITLSTQKKEQLDELAEEYHNENTSACVRTAVETYRLSREGESIEAIEKLRNSVDMVHKELDELREVVEDSNEKTVASQPTQESQRAAIPSSKSGNDVPDGLKSEIHEYLLNIADGKASVSELAEALNKDSLKIDSAVHRLCSEYEFVEMIEEDSNKIVESI